MEITAAIVKTLRDATGAGMMECKAALTEANGDMEAATTYCASEAWRRPPNGRGVRPPRA